MTEADLWKRACHILAEQLLKAYGEDPEPEFITVRARDAYERAKLEVKEQA